MPTEAEKQEDRLALREYILKSGRYAIHTGSVPDDLKSRPGSEIYVDAVIQAVELLGYPSWDPVGTKAAVPTEEVVISADVSEAEVWTTAVIGHLLLDGHYDATDQRFFQHVQRKVTELSGSAVQTNTVQIDGHVSSDPGKTPITMFAPVIDFPYL